MVEDIPEIPSLSEELIEALDKRFPERCPSPEWSERKIWMEVGKREVVRFLKRVYAEQNENILTRD